MPTSPRPRANRPRPSASLPDGLQPVRAEIVDRGADLDIARPRGQGGVPGRHTVSISGLGAEGYASRHGTRPSRAERHSQLRRHERAGFRPDRVALWAVMLGVMMILLAAASSHAATMPAAARMPARVARVAGAHAQLPRPLAVARHRRRTARG